MRVSPSMNSGGEESRMHAVHEHRPGGWVGRWMEGHMVCCSPALHHPSSPLTPVPPYIKVRTMADVWVWRRLLRAQTKGAGPKISCLR
jgi:hypothetical protein